MEFFISITFIVAGTVWIGLLLAALFGRVILSLLPAHRNDKVKWPANAVEAEAIVLKMEPTGIFVNKMPQVKVQMQVQPDKGRNFVTEISTVLSCTDMQMVKTGGMIRVKYNPQNYRELFLIIAA